MMSFGKFSKTTVLRKIEIKKKMEKISFHLLKKEKIMSNENSVVNQILENQEAIMSALIALLTPHCKGQYNDKCGETEANAELAKRYRETRKLLGKEN